MIEVTCMCGYQARGTEDDVVRLLQEHGLADHGAASSREKILGMAMQIGDPGDDAAT
jgi:predicted small metal-binding protein